MPKDFYKSKTLWFNVITGIVFLATYFFGYQPNDVITHNLNAVVTSPLFIVGVNFVLRLVTTKPIALPPPTPLIPE
jgi:hypothetical protein